MAHSSPIFKALLTKRNRVQKTRKDKLRNRNSKAAKNELRRALKCP